MGIRYWLTLAIPAQVISFSGSSTKNAAIRNSVMRNGALSDTSPFPVGVGITIAHDPLHGSGRAGFPHPALALGNDAHAAQRIGMTDRRQRQPASDEAPHAIPEDAAVLAAPRQRAMPKPADSEPKNCQRRLVHGHSVVAEVSTHNRPQPLALLRGWVRAFVAEVRLSPRSASSATFSVSSAAAP